MRDGMIQGESGWFAHEITQGESILTPSDVEGIKIKAGDRIFTYPDNLRFDNNLWWIYIPESWSLQQQNKILCEAWIKQNGELLKSDVEIRRVKDSIITEVWHD